MDGRIASRQWWEWLVSGMEKMGEREEKNGENGALANVLLGEENKKRKMGKKKWGVLVGCGVWATKINK